MLASTRTQTPSRIRTRRVPLRLKSMLAALFLSGFLLPAQGRCELYLQFLVDRSGSMWASFQGKAKIVQVTEAIDRVTTELPPEVAMGLRVYPPPETNAGGRDPGLRIPLEAANRDRFAEEYPRLNPKGLGSLRDELERALQDFPEGQDTKLLILICDGADTRGRSFCEKPLKTPLPEGLRFYILSLNMKEPADQEELDCLNRQTDGRSIHLTEKDNLVATLLPIARKAYEDEVDRQQSVVEERRRIQSLLSKTRLKVEFFNTLDPFFADSIEVEQCLLDGEEISIDTSLRLKQGEGILLFDRAMAEGTHRLSLRYRKWQGGKGVSSEEGIVEVLVEEGKTSYVRCYPRGALFHWDFAFKTNTF